MTILEALDIAELPEEEQETVLADIENLIQEGLLVRIAEQMDEETSAAFTALLDAEADEDAVQAFLAEHVPQLDTLLAETVEELKNDILAATGTNTK